MSTMLYEANGHTTLLPFTWQGKGTSEVECLQSAFRRIAFAHRVPPGVLFNLHFKSALEKHGLRGQNNPLIMSKLRSSIAADSVLLRCVAMRIAELTGEQDAVNASLGGLTALFCPLGLASRVGRFCRYCLIGRHDAMYGRALWDFAAVSACPIHKVCLVEPICGTPESERIRGPWAIQLSGVCSRCGMKRMRCQVGREVFAEKDELWAAEQIGEVIAFASGGGYVDADGMREGIAQCIKLTGKWTFDRPNHVGLSYSYVARWIRGIIKPRVQGLLTLASMCGTSLLDILCGNVSRRSEGAVCQYHYPGFQRRASNKPFPRERKVVQAALKALIHEEGIQCVTGGRLAQRLNVSDAWLATNYPHEWEECQRIRTDNRRIQAAQRESELEGLVLAAAHRVRLADDPLTSYRVYKAMVPVPQRYGAREVSKAIDRCVAHLISTGQ